MNLAVALVHGFVGGSVAAVIGGIDTLAVGHGITTSTPVWRTLS